MLESTKNTHFHFGVTNHYTRENSRITKVQFST